MTSESERAERNDAFEISEKTMQRERRGKKRRGALINLSAVCESVEWLSALLVRCELAIMLTIKGQD